MKKFLTALSLLSVFTATISAQLLNQNRGTYDEPRKMAYVLGAIESLYTDTVDTHKLVESAIVHMLKELDPHSTYIPKEEFSKANEALEGSFEGIGIQFQMLQDTLFVVQTISGCPAEKVGIRAGDRIIFIEDTLIAGVKMLTTDIMRKLRGKKGTTVSVSVLRADVPTLITFSITRDKIPIYSIDAAYMIEPTIGYIKINNFAQTTMEEYQKGVSELKKQGMKSLIIDLQSNGGGSLQTAIDLADEFLGTNQIVVYTEGANQPRSEALATSKGGFEQGKLVVLVDEYAASASEIVSGAVQDWDRGVVIGRRTFGKGLVQRQLMLPDGSALRLTTARYHTPSGRSIQKPYKGVDYQKDIETRYKNGEFMHADSIHFPDSLKYQTLVSKRTVYGGGGIMPDVFVPLDTTRYTDYHRSIVARGVLNRTIVSYVDKNRKQLHKKFTSFERYQKEFQVSDELLNQLIANAEEEKIEMDVAQWEKSKPLLTIQIKAVIARDLWSQQEYFVVMNQENDIVKKALEVIKKDELYQQQLK